MGRLRLNVDDRVYDIQERCHIYEHRSREGIVIKIRYDEDDGLEYYRVEFRHGGRVWYSEKDTDRIKRVEDVRKDLYLTRRQKKLIRDHMIIIASNQ